MRKGLSIIDWWSPRGHENFNLAFLETLEHLEYRFYVFVDYSSLKSNGRVVRLESGDGRLQRAVSLLRLLKRIPPSQPILFLSYDPMFLPVVRLLGRQIFLYEHNTTPEKHAYKHIIWQCLMLRGVRRFTQFPPQERRLLELGQGARHLGSPLGSFVSQASRQRQAKIFLLSSARSDEQAVIDLMPLFVGESIFCKRASQRLLKTAEANSVRVKVMSRLDFSYDESAVAGVIVAVRSPLRGSGWVNDSVSRGIPVITVTAQSRQVVEQTFPSLRFVDAMVCDDKEKFLLDLQSASNQDFESIIKCNNSKISETLAREIGAL